MITLSNGHSFKYATGSGAMGPNGRGYKHEQPLRLSGLLDLHLFTHRLKTITLPPRKGNYRWWKPWDCIRPIWENGKIVGTMNAFGLTNPGFEWFLPWITPYARDTSIPLIVSIFSDAENSAEELGHMALKIERSRLPFVAIEFNTSCPNTGHGVEKNVETIVRGVRAIRRNCDLPLGLKVAVGQDYETILKEVEGEIQYLDINSVQWRIIFPDRISPLAKYGGGGVSGKIAQPYTWNLVENLVSITSVPVIGPGMWKYGDLAQVRTLGAKAVSFASVFTFFPWRPTLYVRRDMASR